ncbi:ATP-binding cassette sub-family C member Sur-like [Macrosteles quadrilineatus]|uniref:ATP-binding cassette sub-family C member Sur-like n=1 Tax=Macrosteles quadrilineatus TaxID=74068 RepID=UPI0023E25FD0|nr:ATP-binding cassette sub-family C member Sur-like [Macrosteles quadrilineatus]
MGEVGEMYSHHSAQWFSQVTFYWLVPLLRAGYSHPLELEDLGTLHPNETAANQFSLFNSVYQRAKATGGHPVRLWGCYMRCYWTNFVLGGLLKLLGDCVGFIPPLGIAVVINYISAKDNITHPEPHDVTVEELLGNGYVMAAVVLVSVMAQGSFSQASTHIVNVEGIRLKTALQALVYDKALKLRSLCKEDDSAQESRTGNLTNLMSEDTFNIMSCYWIGHYVWAIPLKIGILMYLLYCKLGISAIIGATCCILILTPLQFLVGKKMSVNSKDISDWSDERLRQTNEVLQGIRLIKLCGWETEFTNRILTTRQKELEFLNKDSLYWALMTFLTHTSSALITLVTLAAFYWLEGSHLSAADVFTGLALFNQLTVPLFIFPITVPIIIQALVSTRRLEEFLDLPESRPFTPVDEHQVKQVDVRPVMTRQPEPDVVETSRASRADSVFGLGNITELDEPDEDCDEIEPDFDRFMPVVAIEAATFSWAAQEEATLVIPSLHFPRGKLTMIVGSTGSGKSSLLCAMLGEIPCIKGAVRWTKGCSIAYVSQKPWLLNCSLRDNILFGRPYRSRRYNRVIAATALQPDIDILPGKDMTDIGERGINLSGGQRQRVVIARALYSRANVVIMDDPLSALDQQVAQQVFEEGIRRLVIKEKRSVVMVTHCVQLISLAHQVVVIDKGRVKACGSPAELERAGVTVLGRSLGETHKGRTARERWQLIKLVSRIGLQLKQRNLADGTWHADHITPPIFVPFRRRLSKFSGSRYFTHDLPLPTDECDGEDVVLRRRRAASTTSLPQRRAVTRTSSLQTPTSHYIYPVKRQASSPTINNVPRTRTYTFDISSSSSASERHPSASGSGLLRQLFSMSTQRNLPSVADTTVREHTLLRRLISTSSVKSAAIVEAERPPLHRLSSTTSDCSDDFLDEDETLETSEWGQGGGAREEREYGQIQRRIYLSYLQACGALAGATYLLATVSWQGLRVGTDYWLSKWTEESSSKMLYYLVVYGVLSVASILLSLATNGLGQYCGARARQRLHDSMLDGLLSCPVRFFETTPLGRIMNRFSTDLGIIDKKIATSLQRLLQFLLLCFSAILVNCIVTPWFIVLALPICLVYYTVQKFYRSSTRELQRLDSISRTPILSHFAETLSGLETIRAFGQQQRFAAVLFHRLDIHTNVFLLGNSCNRWLGIALDYLGGLIVFITMITSLVSAALFSNVVSPALVGLAINYTLLVPIYLNWVVKFLADMEMYMGSVERVTQYASAPSEDYRHSRFVPKNWPTSGDIKFQNVSLQYDSNRVITNLTLHIPAGQKVGICGRTGSGKSSLVMSLFHMVPICEGAIYIDDVDIATLPLKVVRSRLSIIPQDVIMFSGTIRQNLDLKGQFTDAELWQSLEVAQMKDVVANDLGGLDGPVREGGSNLSCGQRQLMCLARAVLHRAALLVMDEATSCLDPVTEARLLQVATQAFADRTVITIAHRVSGLLGCDRVLVLDRGRVVEDASPAELLNHKMGLFSSMLRKSEDPL